MIEGFIVMFLWGLGTYLQAIPVRKIGTLKAMFIANIVGMIIPVASFLIFKDQLKISSFNFILILLSGIFLVLGIYFLYSGFEKGEISVLSPINGAYAIVTIILSVIFFKESLGFIKLLIILFIIAGVFLLSADFRKMRNVLGLQEVLIAVLLQGLSFFLLAVIAKEFFFLGYRSEQTSLVTLFVLSSIINTALFLLLALVKKQIPQKKDYGKKNVLILFATSIIFSAAWVVFNLALGSKEVSLLMPISSLSPGVTVLLAVIFMKEKLLWNQKLGILVTLIGVFLIGL